MDREKIWTVGKNAVGEFLRKLQIYKSTADVEGGTAFFADYTKVEGEDLYYR